MNKHQIKIETINEFGNKLDDILENQNKEFYRCEGEVRALQKVLKVPSIVSKSVDLDADAGKVSLEEAKVLKNLIARVESAIQAQLAHTDSLVKYHLGLLDGTRRAVEEAKKQREQEVKALEAILISLDKREPTVGQTGLGGVEKNQNHTTMLEDVKTDEKRQRPPVSIKAQRIAEQIKERSDQRLPKKRYKAKPL